MLLLVVGAGFAIVGVGPWRLVCGLERLVAKLGVAREREGLSVGSPTPGFGGRRAELSGADVADFVWPRQLHGYCQTWSFGVVTFERPCAAYGPQPHPSTARTLGTWGLRSVRWLDLEQCSVGNRRRLSSPSCSPANSLYATVLNLTFHSHD
jgi:hypothetical protein